MTINFQNIICLDLRVINSTNIEKFCVFSDIHPDQVAELKSLDVIKVWIDTTSDKFVAFQSKNEDIKVKPAYCPVTKKEVKKLVSMTPVTFKQIKSLKSKISKDSIEDKVSVILEVDAILDKISAKGMSSLTTEELEFLKNQ